MDIEIKVIKNETVQHTISILYIFALALVREANCSVINFEGWGISTLSEKFI
jgi:hypothetical protein